MARFFCFLQRGGLVKQKETSKETSGMKQVVLDAVYQLVESVLAEYQLELVELQFRRESHGYVLRILIHKETGVTLNDCEAVSRQVGHLLEVEDLIEHAYHLEVSSPGLDRPLKTEKDFLRYRGKKIQVDTNAPIEAQNNIVGSIDDARDGNLYLRCDTGVHKISYEQIN